MGKILSFYHTSQKSTEALTHVPLLAFTVDSALVGLEVCIADAAVKTLMLRGTLSVKGTHRIKAHDAYTL